MNTISWKDSKILRVLFWISVVWFFYGFTLFFDFFVFDDGVHIWDNVFTGVRTPEDLFFYWKFSLTPVIFFVWQLVSLVFTNQEAAPFRALNLLLMGGCSYLVYDLSKNYLKILSKNHDPIERILPYLVTLFFILHPAQVESVVWVSSARTLLATLCALLSLKSLSLVENEDDFSKYTFLTVFFFVLGILSKPSIVTLPVLMVAILTIKGRSLKQSLIGLWPILLVGLVMGFLHVSEVFTPYLKSLSYADRSIIVLDSVTQYFKILFLPFIQSFDYARNPAKVVFEWESNKILFMLTPLLIISSLVAGLFVERLKKWALAMIGFYALLLPNMGFIYYDFQNISTSSSRYLHLPLVIISFALIPLGLFILEKWKNNKKVLLTLSFVPLFIMAVCNFNYSRLWKNSLDVLSYSRSVTGPTYALSMSMGSLYYRFGHYQLAEKSFLEAWELEPSAYGPISSLIDLYQLYKFPGKIDSFLSKVIERKIIITPDKSLDIAKLFDDIEDFYNAKYYAGIAFKMNVNKEESQQLYQRSTENLVRAKVKHFIFIIKDFEKNKKFNEAKDLLKKAFIEYPNSSELVKLSHELFESEHE